MASVFATAGTVIAAALMTVAATEQTGDLVPVFVGGGIAAVLFVIAASCCVKATMPVGFSLPGSQPESWLRDIDAGMPIEQSLAEQASNFQRKIEENRSVLESNAFWFKWGARAGIAAPFVGLAGWLGTLLLRFCL